MPPTSRPARRPLSAFRLMHVPPQQLTVLTNGRNSSDHILWRTRELPREEQPSSALLDQLRSGSAMVVQAFGLPPLRFDLASGRPDIAEFKDVCDRMLDLPPLGDEPGARQTEPQSQGTPPVAERRPAPQGHQRADPKGDVPQGCRRACEGAVWKIEVCNAGRQPEDAVPQAYLDGLAADFEPECLDTCAAATGNRDFFTVNLHLDRLEPNQCGYRWTWCTPNDDWTVCAPPVIPLTPPRP